MMFNWPEIKRVLYIFLTVCGVALFIGSFPLVHSNGFADQLAGLLFFLTGSSLLVFGLVCYIDRDDWEIWS